MTLNDPTDPKIRSPVFTQEKIYKTKEFKLYNYEKKIKQ